MHFRHYRLRRIASCLFFLLLIFVIIFSISNFGTPVQIINYARTTANLSPSLLLPSELLKKDGFMQLVSLIDFPDAIIRQEPLGLHADSVSDKSSLSRGQNEANISSKLEAGVTIGTIRNRGTKLTADEVRGGLPLEPIIRDRLDFVRNMARHAWGSYKKYAWGYNELSPNRNTFYSANVFGRTPIGVTILDSIDTLYIMNLDAEYNEARNWIENSLNFDVDSNLSVFEFTIRVIGGLLGIFSLTLDPIFLTKAVDGIIHILPAFDTPTGIPLAFVNFATNETFNYLWTPTQCSILSEVGSLHMEFQYLSELTGSEKYSRIVHRIRDYLMNVSSPDGIFYNFINPRTGNYCSKEISIASQSDSYYEYLLKEWIRTGKEDKLSRVMFDTAIEGIQRKGLLRMSPAGSLYVANYKSGHLTNTMEHLACFTGGLFALGAANTSDKMFSIGEKITDTCHKSYVSSDTHLGPDYFNFSDFIDAVSSDTSKKYFLLRPETVESYFYLWRFTKDEKYREWAWDFAQALEKYCRSDSGYSGIHDVYNVNSPKDNMQQSFFLAETLKYLYLIFSDDTLLPLDRWVFNTEAHPFPIRGKVDLGEDIWPK